MYTKIKIYHSSIDGVLNIWLVLWINRNYNFIGESFQKLKNKK